MKFNTTTFILTLLKQETFKDSFKNMMDRETQRESLMAKDPLSLSQASVIMVSGEMDSCMVKEFSQTLSTKNSTKVYLKMA